MRANNRLDRHGLRLREEVNKISSHKNKIQGYFRIKWNLIGKYIFVFYYWWKIHPDNVSTTSIFQKATFIVLFFWVKVFRCLFSILFFRFEMNWFSRWNVFWKDISFHSDTFEILTINEKKKSFHWNIFFVKLQKVNHK